MSPTLHSSIKNSIWNTIGFFLSTILGLILLPIVIEGIGIANYGLYGVFMILLLPIGFANLGFDTAAIRFIAKYTETSDWLTASRYFSTALLMNLVVGLLGAFFIILIGPSLIIFFFKNSINNYLLIKQCLYWVALGWVANQLRVVIISVPTARREYRKMTLGNCIIALVNFALVLLAVKGGASLPGYTAAVALSTVFATIYWTIILKKSFPAIIIKPVLDKQVFKNSFNYGGWLTLANIGGMLSGHGERFLLGTLLSTSALGIYTVAATIEGKAYALASKINEVMFPTFSALSDASRARKSNILMRSSFFMTTIYVSIGMPIIPLSEEILTAWINTEIALNGSTILILLVFAGILGAASNISYLFLLAEGYTRIIMIRNVLAGVVTIAVAALMIPYWGIPAAGLGALAAMIVQRLIYDVSIKKILREDLSMARLVSSLYVPIFVGIIINGLTFKIVNLNAPDWITIIAIYILLSLATGFTIILVASILPSCKESINDIYHIRKIIVDRLKVQRS